MVSDNTSSDGRLRYNHGTYAEFAPLFEDTFDSLPGIPIHVGTGFAF